MTDLTEHEAVITKEGYEKAVEELNELRDVKRLEISEKIKAAKEMGDISENAEYQNAKEEQAFTEARIKELESLIKFATVTTGPVDPSTVEVGDQVTVEGSAGEKVYTIVGFNEANPSAGKISNESPLGRAIVGKKVGETVTFASPSGETKLKIIKIG